jgi:hypothetical protein
LVATAAALAGLAGTLDAQLHPPATREPAVRSLDPRYDRLVPPGTVPEKITDGHGWTEGPV